MVLLTPWCAQELLGCLTEELSRRLEASQDYHYEDDEFDERKCVHFSFRVFLSQARTDRYVADPSTVAKTPPSKDAIRAFITKVSLLWWMRSCFWSRAVVNANNIHENKNNYTMIHTRCSRRPKWEKK